MKASKKKKRISAKLRESDDALREQLQNFDVKKFGKLLQKAVRPTSETK
jgi:hypothetical protein